MGRADLGPAGGRYETHTERTGLTFAFGLLSVTGWAMGIGLAVGWALLLVDAWRLGNPPQLLRQQRLAMTGLNGMLVFGVAGALLFASHLVTVQKDFISTMFGGKEVSSATDGRYTDVRAYTSQGPSRLEVLASEQDPAVSEAFSEVDYRRTVTLLEHFYNVVLTDCGTGLMHSAMKGVLDQADSLVLVSSGSVDGAQTSAATLDWLDAHGYRDLVTGAGLEDAADQVAASVQAALPRPRHRFNAQPP